MKRRNFIKNAGLGAAGVVAATTISAPYVKAQKTIKWRLQTYAGPALAAALAATPETGFSLALTARRGRLGASCLAVVLSAAMISSRNQKGNGNVWS